MTNKCAQNSLQYLLRCELEFRLPALQSFSSDLSHWCFSYCYDELRTWIYHCCRFKMSAVPTDARSHFVGLIGLHNDIQTHRERHQFSHYYLWMVLKHSDSYVVQTERGKQRKKNKTATLSHWAANKWWLCLKAFWPHGKHLLTSQRWMFNCE